MFSLILIILLNMVCYIGQQYNISLLVAHIIKTSKDWNGIAVNTTWVDADRLEATLQFMLFLFLQWVGRKYLCIIQNHSHCPSGWPNSDHVFYSTFGLRKHGLTSKWTSLVLELMPCHSSPFGMGKAGLIILKPTKIAISNANLRFVIEGQNLGVLGVKILCPLIRFWLHRSY